MLASLRWPASADCAETCEDSERFLNATWWEAALEAVNRHQYHFSAFAQGHAQRRQLVRQEICRRLGGTEHLSCCGAFAVTQAVPRSSADAFQGRHCLVIRAR